MSETNGNKLLFFLGIQRQRLGANVQPGEARFGPELDGEKLWRLWDLHFLAPITALLLVSRLVTAIPTCRETPYDSYLVNIWECH